MHSDNEIGEHYARSQDYKRCLVQDCHSMADVQTFVRHLETKTPGPEFVTISVCEDLSCPGSYIVEKLKNGPLPKY